MKFFNSVEISIEFSSEFREFAACVIGTPKASDASMEIVYNKVETM